MGNRMGTQVIVGEEAITEPEKVESEDEESKEQSKKESEEEEEEAEQLEEMRPPVVTSWIGPDGVRVHGVMCIDDGIIRLKNRCRFDECPICFKPSTAHGKHQLCCLPCGHTYGFSCVEKWLLLRPSSGKCPKCNVVCSSRDTILLYPPRLCDTAHQKASSAAFFPFTKQGFHEFKEYEYSRRLDAQSLRADDITHVNSLVTKQIDLADRAKELATQRDNLLTLAKEVEERGESLGLVDELRKQASPLKPQVKALRRRTDALERLVSALRRRMDALEQRSDAFESRIRFYDQVCKEHHMKEKAIAKAKQALKMRKKLAEKAAAKANKKDMKEAEKAAEKKMKASDTVDLPEEKVVEDNRMGTEKEAITEPEEEESKEESEEEEEEKESEEEEVEQLEEMRPPVVTSWIGPDGVRVHGIMCIDDGIFRLKNRCRFDECPICFIKPSTTDGKHQLCYLPCGHTYGFSCIRQWLTLSSFRGKCPQCNVVCSSQDAILIYPPRLCDTAHQKASSSATLFPFTEQGFQEFKEYENSRRLDAQSLRADDITHVNFLVTKQIDLADRAKELARQRDNLLARAKELEERAESLEVADELRKQARPLKGQVKALGRRTDALERLVSALRRRMDALEQRSDAFESRIRFYDQVCKEHHQREKAIEKAKQGLEMKKKLAEKAAAKFVRVRSGVILKRMYSNSYMDYYAAGAAAVLNTVLLAVGYSLYA